MKIKVKIKGAQKRFPRKNSLCVFCPGEGSSCPWPAANRTLQSSGTKDAWLRPSDPLSKVSGPQYAYVLIFHMFLRFNEGKEAL